MAFENKSFVEVDENEWTTDLENVLDRIRINSTTLSEYHKERYYKYKGYLKYFKIPTIILSAFSSVFSVGLQNFVSQGIVSIVTCLIGLFVGILNSLELFLAIAQTMESELTHSRDFYLLSVDICKTLLLKRPHRLSTGRAYLDEKYGVYCKLVENSILVDKTLNDQMLNANALIHESVHGLLANGSPPSKLTIRTSNVVTTPPRSPQGARERWQHAFQLVRNSGGAGVSNATSALASPTLVASPVTTLTTSSLPTTAPTVASAASGPAFATTTALLVD
jgi:hypothetical protein